jgi:hypothetical protein
MNRASTIIGLCAASVLLLSSGMAFAEPQLMVLPTQTVRLPTPVLGGKIVIHMDRGGVIEEYKQRWTWNAAMGSTVEIRGPCASACTYAVSYIPRQRVCFDDNGLLAFHLARNQKLATGEWIPNHELTKALVDSYPVEIREWIDNHGGYLQLPWDGFLVLRAPQLWAMGFSRCV